MMGARLKSQPGQPPPLVSRTLTCTPLSCRVLYMSGKLEGTVVWNCLPSRYLPRTSMPLMVTSCTVPWFTSDKNCVKFLSVSFWPPPLFLTTCQSRTADRIITSQNTTVFTVEFTGTPLMPYADTLGTAARTFLDANQG